MSIRFLFVVCVLLGCLSACSRPESRPSPDRNVLDAAGVNREFEAGMSLAFQGDLRSALPHLRGLPLDHLAPRRRQAVAGMLARFDAPASAAPSADLDPWTRDLLEAFRRYWTSVLLRQSEPQAAEQTLGHTLARLAGSPVAAGSPVDLGTLEPKLMAELEARGLHALFGVTSPYREFLLWRKQGDLSYDVDLPEGHESVRVAMLEDFESLGWLGYATGEVYHTGGWTKPDRLYCVKASYDLGSETFRVSYLAHEGQHFSDDRRFPELKQPELEYRAKLVEIALAQGSQSELLSQFHGNRSSSRDQPHPFANRRLMQDLARAVGLTDSPETAWWTGLPPERLRAAAKQLLLDDTRAIETKLNRPRS